MLQQSVRAFGKFSLTVVPGILCALVMGSIPARSCAQVVMRIHLSDGTELDVPDAELDSVTFLPQAASYQAVVATSAVTAIGATTASTGGSISGFAGLPVLMRGVCWSTHPNPTVGPNSTADGSGTGTFGSSLVGLLPSTPYFVRAYALTDDGPVYGNQVLFTTGALLGVFVPGGGVTDLDGNVYPTVVFGTGDEWMAANLRVTSYSNGDPIPYVPASVDWATTTTGIFTYPDSVQANDAVYGKLYNGYAVTDPRGVCPAGWHLPSVDEWTVLGEYLGGLGVTGGKLKSTGTVQASNGLWQSPNTGATNESGMNAHPAGFLSVNVFGESYASFGTVVYFWSWNVSGGFISHATVQSSVASMSFANGNLPSGRSVRCKRD